MTTHPRGPEEKIRVFLLDDHEVVRRGLKELLESEGDIEVVGESGLAQEATRRIPALRPDVAVLDARLPDGSGIDVCRDIRSTDPAIATLILTSYDDDEALFAAIMAGASGYVLKEIAGHDLVGAVRQVAAGNSLIDPALTARVLDRVRNGPATVPELSDLTEQDLQDGFRLTGLFLLRHVLEPRGQGHSEARAGFINALMRQQARAAIPAP